jgi:hypothetical protein
MEGIQPSADFGWQMADSSRVAPPPSSSADPIDQKKQQVAKDFESVLLTRLFAQVQQTMSSLDPEEEGTGQQVQGLFWLYLARDAADKGGFGLWKEIYQHLPGAPSAMDRMWEARQIAGVPNPADALDEEL